MRLTFRNTPLVTAKGSQSAIRPGISFSNIVKKTETTTIGTQTDFTWPSDAQLPLSTQQACKESQRISSDTTCPIEGATGGHIPPTNIPHYTSTPKTKIQINNAKPGPAFSKPGIGKRPPKGSTDPIKLHNRFGSLSAMDLEVNRSPKTDSGSRKNQ